MTLGSGFFEILSIFVLNRWIRKSTAAPDRIANNTPDKATHARFSLRYLLIIKLELLLEYTVVALEPEGRIDRNQFPFLEIIIFIL